MVAPLIRPIRLQGGTFYTFSSAAEDLSFSLNSADKKFKFSKFALLNIPNLQSNPGAVNFAGLSNTPGAYSIIDGSKTDNDYFAESFQNYCLNLESMITSASGYDPFLDRTVTERVFFKWLKEIGAVRFRSASSQELSSTSFGPNFVEENESENYQKVVKYIGDINIVNTVRNSNNAFSEVYIYIPTSHGNTPVVMFETIDDVNYSPGMYFTNDPTNPLDAEYLYGRDVNTVQPAGLSTLAFFDSDTFTFTVSDPDGNTGDYYFYNPDTNSYILQGQAGFQWWFANPIANTYFLEATEFGDPTNDEFKIESSTKSVTYKRSRLDGISLNFNPAAYAGIDPAQGITDFGKYNESFASANFEFNAVLVYYDVYDPADPTNATTNLFGVLYLDNVDPTTTGGFIPRLTKYKPNALTGDNGNSYAFRINLKFDVNAQDSAVEVSINDYNPYSLQLYMDALNEMIQATTILEQNNAAMAVLQTQVANLQNLILTDADKNQINSRITEISDTLNANLAVFANTENILRLIQRNYDEINNIYQGRTSLNIAYNLDVLSAGQGISLDKSAAGSVVVSTNQQEFNIGSKPLVSVANDFTQNPETYSYNVDLIPFSNYMKITDGSPGSPYEIDRDVVIFINDTLQKWQKGQSIRISFTNGLDMSNNNGNFNFIVYTDAQDSLNTGSTYSAEAAFVTYQDFTNKGDAPTIEIVCLDPTTYQFSVDIF